MLYRRCWSAPRIDQIEHHQRAEGVTRFVFFKALTAARKSRSAPRLSVSGMASRSRRPGCRDCPRHDGR